MKSHTLKAFTLVELLVVLAVMGLMMGVIGFSLLGGGGAELGASQRELVAMLQKARTKAALAGSATRLIINNDPEDLEKFHRYMEIVIEDTNESEQWIVEGEGKFLADGIYFVPQMKSQSDRNEDWSNDAFTRWSHNEGEDFQLNDSFRGIRKEEQGTSFCYLEFDGSGNLVCPSVNSSSTPTPPLLVIANGSPNPQDPNAPLRFDDPNSIAGILMRRFGGFAILEKTDFDPP